MAVFPIEIERSELKMSQTNPTNHVRWNGTPTAARPLSAYRRCVGAVTVAPTVGMTDAMSSKGIRRSWVSDDRRRD
jgi:hypothetical protein